MGFFAQEFSEPGEKIKREGDKRTPAGVFYAGAPFGFSSLPLTNYLKLHKGVVCIDDPESKHYGAILKDGPPIGVSHEKMWRISVYRHGLIVRTTNDAALRSGSCIFLHVWRGSNSPTVGCVAFSEKQMKRIQLSLNEGIAAVAILPYEAHKLLSRCNFPRP